MTTTKNIEVLPYFQVETLPETKKGFPLQIQLARAAFAFFGRIFPAWAAKVGYHLFTKPRIRAVHKTTDPLLESARLFEFMYGKLILKGYEWGKGDRTVLLVHGWESRGTAMRSFVPELLEAGFRVVTFDAPAHGNSQGTNLNLMQFAGAVRAIIQQTGGVHGIITHSFGGAATAFAMAHLDTGIEVEKLVLIAVPASTQKVVRNAMRLMNMPPAAVERFRKILRQKVNNLSFEQTDLVHSLGKVKVGEVLVVHDKLDDSVPFESAEALFERHEHVSLLVTQGWGHFKLMKRREVTGRVTNFVAGM